MGWGGWVFWGGKHRPDCLIYACCGLLWAVPHWLGYSAGQLSLNKLEWPATSYYVDIFVTFFNYSCVIVLAKNFMNYIAAWQRLNYGPLTSASLLQSFQLSGPKHGQCQMMCLYTKTDLVWFIAVLEYVHHNTIFLPVALVKTSQSQFFSS